jgi:hypothetical protein
MGQTTSACHLLSPPLRRHGQEVEPLAGMQMSLIPRTCDIPSSSSHHPTAPLLASMSFLPRNRRTQTQEAPRGHPPMYNLPRGTCDDDARRRQSPRPVSTTRRRDRRCDRPSRPRGGRRGWRRRCPRPLPWSRLFPLWRQPTNLE